MPRRIEEQWKQLEKLKNSKCKRERKKILKEGGKPLQLCLRECAVNVLQGKVPLTPKEKIVLKRHAEKLRMLKSNITGHKKRIQIEQKSGFLPALIAPILGAVLGGLLKKK